MRQQPKNHLSYFFGYDCRTPSKAALLPPSSLEPATVADYREHVMLSLSSAQELVVQTIQKAQGRYRKISILTISLFALTYSLSKLYADFFKDVILKNRKSVKSQLKVGDWVLLKFPQDKTGRLRKLSRPCNRPYHIVSRKDPDVSVIKTYCPLMKSIQVHLS